MSGLSTLLSPLAILAAEKDSPVPFPDIADIVIWPAYFGDGTWYEFNKIGLISVISFVVPALLFFLAGRNAKLVPTGVQNLMETGIDFVENQIIGPAIGKDGMRYLPMLSAMMFFIWVNNIFEILPTANMPATARMANPMMLALVAMVMFIGIGLKHHGLGYLKDVMFPPGVPKVLYILVTPIEILSTFLIRPFSLAVRLFANMLAGNILLLTFAVLCIATFGQGLLTAVTALTFPLLISFFLFEFMVAFLQAFIFALLTAVYIGSSLHPAH